MSFRSSRITELFLCLALFLTELRQRMPQQGQGLFRSMLQLFGELKQFGDADTLNDADIHLSGQQIRAFILQKFLDLVHENDEIQGIQAEASTRL